jgi:hypothetical protein
MFYHGYKQNITFTYFQTFVFGGYRGHLEARASVDTTVVDFLNR